MLVPCQFRLTQLAFTEMPRLRSTGRLSVRVVPLSTLPAWRMAPACISRCSVRVVLPASTWANMPIFRSCMLVCISFVESSVE